MAKPIPLEDIQELKDNLNLVNTTVDEHLAENVSEIGDRLYTEENYVTDGETLTASIDKLDTELKDTNDSIGDRLYTEENYVANLETVTSSIDKLDMALNDVNTETEKRLDTFERMLHPDKKAVLRENLNLIKTNIQTGSMQGGCYDSLTNSIYYNINHSDTHTTIYKVSPADGTVITSKDYTNSELGHGAGLTIGKYAGNEVLWNWTGGTLGKMVAIDKTTLNVIKSIDTPDNGIAFGAYQYENDIFVGYRTGRNYFVVFKLINDTPYEIYRIKPDNFNAIISSNRQSMWCDNQFIYVAYNGNWGSTLPEAKKIGSYVLVFGWNSNLITTFSIDAEEIGEIQFACPTNYKEPQNEFTMYMGFNNGLVNGTQREWNIAKAQMHFINPELSPPAAFLAQSGINRLINLPMGTPVVLTNPELFSSTASYVNGTDIDLKYMLPELPLASFSHLKIVYVMNSGYVANDFIYRVNEPLYIKDIDITTGGTGYLKRVGFTQRSDKLEFLNQSRMYFTAPDSITAESPSTELTRIMVIGYI